MLHKVFVDSIKLPVAFTLLIVLVLPGISRAETKELTIMLTEATYNDGYRRVANEIEKKLGITVTFQTAHDTEFADMVKIKFVTKDVPDILIANVPAMYYLVHAQKNCVNLNDQPWVERLVNPEYIMDEIGDIYAFPEQAAGGFSAVLYNKKVFAELGLTEPTTYSEFLDLLEKGKQAGLTPFQASNADLWTTQLFMTNGFPTLVSKKDSDIWTKLMTNQLKFADVPEFEMILSDYLDLYAKGYVNENHLTTTFTDAKEAFGTGKALVWFIGEWAPNRIRNEYPDIEVGFFRLPYRGEDVLSIRKTVKGYMVPKGSGNEELALEYLNALSQSEVFSLFFQEKPGYPSLEGVEDGDLHPDVRKLVEEYVNTGKYVYEMNHEMFVVRPILNVLWKLYIEMINGQMTPKEVLESWDERVEEFMISKGEPGW